MSSDVLGQSIWRAHPTFQNFLTNQAAAAVGVGALALAGDLPEVAWPVSRICGLNL